MFQHDTYAERMNILSLIYSIPVDSHLTASTNYASASVRPSSPETSASEVSDYPSRPASSTENRGDSQHPAPQYTTLNGPREIEDGVEAIGTAMFGIDHGYDSGRSGHTSQHSISSTVSSTSTLVAHPYSNTQPGDFGETNGTFVGNRARTSTLPAMRNSNYSSTVPHRSRASSTLPPAAPPPTNSLPPAPTPEPPSTIRTIPELPEPPARQIVNPLGHRRTGSGTKLGTLREEVERREETVREQFGLEQDPPLRRPRSKSVLSAQRQYNDSQPLPPLPPVENHTPATPRFSRNSGQQSGPSSPDSSNFVTPRARGDSSVSARSDSSSVGSLTTTLINNSPVMGTISQRRSKTSAPPSVTGSPTEAQMSASVPSMTRLTASGAPNNTVQMLSLGRSRAASQPGRRPTISASYPINSTMQIQTVSGPGMRKVSIPSKLGPNAQMSISINTVLNSPPTVTAASMLVPPPPILPEHLPSAPTSPLPPAPPTEPLRQPYHMMNLLRQTMTSKTGGYVTRRLHVPCEVWSQGGAKLANIPEKIRVVEVLLSALEEIQNCSVDIFGAGNVSSGMVLGIGSIGKKEGEVWSSKLEDFSSVCDGVVANFGKKLAVGEGFITKKSGGVRVLISFACGRTSDHLPRSTRGEEDSRGGWIN